MSQFHSETPILSATTARPITVAGSSAPSFALRNNSTDVALHTTHIAKEQMVRYSNAYHSYLGHVPKKSHGFKKYMFRLVGTTVMSLGIMTML